jgi:hypothetical protein
MPELEHSDALRELLRQHVDSHEKLDIVLWLRRCPEPAGVAALQHALGLPRTTVRDVLHDLIRMGLVAHPAPELFAYAPVHEHLGRAVDELALAVETDPIPILRRLSANAIDRVRGSAAEAFAEAFMWSTRKPDD